jgi:serine/threonine protein kinase
VRGYAGPPSLPPSALCLTHIDRQGSLRNLLDRRYRFTENELMSVLRQVGKGLHRMHSLNLVHLDIKPENIYVTAEGMYKIGDLGLVTRADSRDPVEVPCDQPVARRPRAHTRGGCRVIRATCVASCSTRSGPTCRWPTCLRWA